MERRMGAADDKGNLSRRDLKRDVKREYSYIERNLQEFRRGWLWKRAISGRMMLRYDSMREAA
jgi:hypothetical protein